MNANKTRKEELNELLGDEYSRIVECYVSRDFDGLIDSILRKVKYEVELALLKKGK